MRTRGESIAQQIERTSDYTLQRMQQIGTVQTHLQSLGGVGDESLDGFYNASNEFVRIEHSGDVVGTYVVG